MQFRISPQTTTRRHQIFAGDGEAGEENTSRNPFRSPSMRASLNVPICMEQTHKQQVGPEHRRERTTPRAAACGTTAAEVASTKSQE
ncbi:hypothetical protein AYI68_g589 [Smittium mucronatum]|uniref:Uncharacterized protein n=1 Tax=Smittium mucronatum TaxID=133383 RepID=A0A1R0H7R9_9FUNG|nr:hypothetical protein AYI68_g589 [Smittium mucronatum]